MTIILIELMRRTVLPSQKDMKKAASNPSFNPRKYLKSINFKKMTRQEASQVEAIAEKVDNSLYEVVKAKLSKRTNMWDTMIKARRCLEAIKKWD